jgi:hypothetical protein
MKCVVLQPSYIPWRGHFHQIYKADVFVFYDDVQYDRRGWRNRNKVKTPSGTKWLTIPVYSKGYQANKLPINEVQICWNTAWNEKHWATLKHLYRKAPHFERYAPLLKELYSRHPDLLADFTIELTVALAKELGIQDTEFIRSSALDAKGSKTDRLLSILQTLGATHYISGPSAKDYLEEEKMDEAGISLEYMAYEYPEYEQLYPPFEPYVSILDLLFMAGPQAPKYIWDCVSSN